MEREKRKQKEEYIREHSLLKELQDLRDCTFHP